MELVGLHAVPICTDFMKFKDSGEDKRLAISVVSAGKNADEAQDPDSLIYTGFGGQESDQKLNRMNLSLEEALKIKSVLRVIRAVEDEKRKHGNIYIYDGLYSITDMWEEKSANGFKVFKFRFVRQPDQKPAFGVWKSIEQWKEGLITRPGLVLQDLSSGAENLKVSLVNEVDDEKGPSSFSYIASLKHSVIDVPPMVDLCTCRPKSCCSGDDFSEVIGSFTAFVISAKKSGNVARFMNHSCSPNVMWQPISREQKGLWCIHIGFFAIKHIPPLTELTYDYGAFRGYGKKKTCLCRSKKCSGSF
ncbi:putative inactive histone-lysine N-methyltransferase family member SUVH10 [Eutrema salsugineum]|uniref:putative inactive histone-lysine N-methyltransferase family member SUVH10 n=1 Tax=Eutrema salsugineum TaxID=72664 RepID=UPI000CED5CB5|nr:putative inactive histone-lysine N-methyltransferase family member SUVH10 [Eutrema salsugineum]